MRKRSRIKIIIKVHCWTEMVRWTKAQMEMQVSESKNYFAFFKRTFFQKIINAKFFSPKFIHSGRRTEEEIVAEAVIVPPDGGYGWVIVAASFLTNAVVDGLIFTVGQGFLPFWEKELADGKASLAAWCVSLLSGCYLLVGEKKFALEMIHSLFLIQLVFFVKKLMKIVLY